MRQPKRTIVLNTAERLFYEEGFHATGIDRIVAEAQVTRMTLYNHFGSKAELIREVLRIRYGRYRRDIESAIEARGSGSALAAMIDVHESWIRNEACHGCMVIRAISEFERHDDAIAADAVGLKRDFLELIESALRLDGRAGESLADRVMTALEGANALIPVLGTDKALVSMHSLLNELQSAPQSKEVS